MTDKHPLDPYDTKDKEVDNLAREIDEIDEEIARLEFEAKVFKVCASIVLFLGIIAITVLLHRGAP